MQMKNNWCKLPTQFGIFRIYDTNNDAVKLISFGDIKTLLAPVLVRIHSSCVASEIFGALDCDCNDQLQQTMKQMAGTGQGIIFHLNQEGRGHGLSNKIEACAIMQQQNLTTAESFTKMNLTQDIRNYDAVIQLLSALNITQIRLITNNPKKYDSLQAHITITERIALKPTVRHENLEYLKSKNIQLNHSIWLDSFMAEDAPIYFYNQCGIYEGFSNFSSHSIFIDGKLWQTLEHYYQAQKFTEDNLIYQIYRANLPLQAKNIADNHKDNIRNNWDTIKQAVTYKALQHKFNQHDALKELLLNTGLRKIYGYSDKDRYWGNNGNDGDVDAGGQNHLGKLIMRLRQKLHEELRG